jgi:hypothetical protein
MIERNFMREVYRIIVTPYHYDIWNIFTEDKELFGQLASCNDTDEARQLMGIIAWEELVEKYENIETPYVLLGEAELREYD